MAIEHPIPVDVLRQLLRLDPETGRLYWLERGIEFFSDGTYPADRACAAWNGRYSGAEGLTSALTGYRYGRIFDRGYMAHRVVFALHCGYWPTGDIDHRDGDRQNNRPDNLREATRSQNEMNKAGSNGGSSAFKGVTWCRQTSQWRAQGTDATGHHRHLGRFLEEAEAACAYDAFARREHGEFARLNFPD